MAQDILITPGSGEPQILFRGSGAIDTAVELNVLSSYQSGTGSGTALLFEGTEGQLFGITDNLSSGTIFSVADITGLPIIEADASGDVKLGEYGRYVGIGTGVPAYGLDVFSSGILRKGVILSNYVPATTTNALYNEGGTLKFNGSSIGGGGVDTYTSGVATYASGQAISNQGNITALLTASGTATSLIASSGIASYASGQAVSNQSNISALLTASGIATSLLAVSGTATSLVATSGIAAYASGQVSPALSAGSGINIDAANRINVYGGTGNFENIQLTTNNTVVPKMVFTGSGVNNPPITLRVESGFQSATGSGTALLFEGEEGVLFSITDNLSSGVIFNVTNDLGLPLVEVEAHGDVKIGESASGIILYKPTLISNGVPSDTANKLYNDAGTLKFNGSSVGGASAESQYASGQAISNQSNITALNTASGVATSLVASSGIATYASGQAVSNQSSITALNTASGIATSLLSVSGTATSLVASSGIATYASGNTANIAFGSNAEGDILYHNGTSFIRLAKGSNDTVLTMNGNVPNWEAAGGGSSLTAASGIVVDGADKINIYGGTGNLQEIQLTSDNIFTPKMIFTGSGVQDTPVTLKVLSSHGAVNTSGTALSFEGTQGQLFGITDNLSSGNIFTVNDITGLPLISANASGDIKLAEYGRYIFSYGGYVQESVPASDTPTTEDATITLDLSAGNYHNVVLGVDVTKFEFTNAKRGQRFLLRITQHASSAKTVAWTNVDYTTGGAAATVRWAGNITPTMSTSTSHTDVYGFLCTNNAGSEFDGFIVGQDLHN